MNPSAEACELSLDVPAAPRSVPLRRKAVDRVGTPVSMDDLVALCRRRDVGTGLLRASEGGALAGPAWAGPTPERTAPAKDPSDAPGPKLVAELEKAMSALDEESRQALLLRETCGLSYDEIALAMGVPRGAVQSRLCRARRQLQELLKGYLDA